LKAVILDFGNKYKGGKWVLKFGRKIGPFCNESERAIRAVTNANLGEEEMSPLSDRSKHGIDLRLELEGPPTR
jgi:hypothetical protein